jgi:hypothetical protein
MTKQQIVAALKKLGYSIDEYGTEYSLINNKTEKTANRITFSLETLGYCCGAKEIGDLEFIEDSPKGKLLTASLLLAKYAFLSIRDENTDKKGKPKNTAYTLIFCGNGVNSSLLAEKALVTMKDTWTHASTNINPGSGRTIRTFVSK